MVSTWLREKLYQPRNLKPQNPVYPFDKNELIKLAKNKPTAREIIDWCAQNFKVPKAATSAEAEKIRDIKQRYQRARQCLAKTTEMKVYIENKIKSDIEKNEEVAKILYFAFESLIGSTLEGQTSSGQMLNKVIIDRVETNRKFYANQDPQKVYEDSSINLKIRGRENGKPFVLGIAIVQQTDARIVSTALRKLIDNQDITRGCLVRSDNKKIRAKTKAAQLLQEFVQVQNRGEKVTLKENEIKPLFELYYLTRNCQKYNLTQAQVKKLSYPEISQNPLLREILSDPSGIIDEETYDYYDYDDTEED